MNLPFESALGGHDCEPGCDKVPDDLPHGVVYFLIQLTLVVHSGRNLEFSKNKAFVN